MRKVILLLMLCVSIASLSADYTEVKVYYQEVDSVQKNDVYTPLVMPTLNMDEIKSVLETESPTIYGLDADGVSFTKEYNLDPSPGFWMDKSGFRCDWSVDGDNVIGYAFVNDHLEIYQMPSRQPNGKYRFDCYIVNETSGNYVTITTTMFFFRSKKAYELNEWIDRIEAMNGDATSLLNILDNEDATTDELQIAIDAAKYLYVTLLLNNAEDKDNVDVTLILENPQYEDGTNGWNIQEVEEESDCNIGIGGLPDNKCFEASNIDRFDVYQMVKKAPVGIYEIEVQGFWRYGFKEPAWTDYKAQQSDYVKRKGVPAYVYLNNNATPLKNVFSEPLPKGTLYTTNESVMHPVMLQPLEDDLGNWYPNEMYNSAMAFNAGMYKQTAFGLIANDGDELRIGVKGNTGKNNEGGGSWSIWDNFKLTYRGLNGTVVKLVMETVIADLEQYATMLMGKTEFAMLNNAMTDAKNVVTGNDVTALLRALDALCDAKDAIVISKDIFLDRDVYADTVRLADAIRSASGNNLSEPILAEAKSLLDGIKNNKLYENNEIDQLKSDVIAMIDALNNPNPVGPKCAKPSVSYADGRLSLACETEGAECVWAITSEDIRSGRGNTISLVNQYRLSVYATAEGYNDSDIVTAILTWGNSKVEGDNVIHIGANGGDVNQDGDVDVADIATIISIMAGQARSFNQGLDDSE